MLFDWGCERLNMSLTKFTHIPGFAVLVSCLTVGGSAVHGLTNNAVLQSFAVGLIVWTIWCWAPSRNGRWRLPDWLLLALVLLVLAHLAAVPPAVWMALPGRELVRDAVAGLGSSPSWRPLSVYPAATLSSFFALLVPVAVYLWARGLDRREQMLACATVMFAALMGATLAFVQLLPTPYAIWLYPAVAPFDPSGLFSNRNHHVTVVAVALILAAAVPLPHESRRRRVAQFGVAIVMLLLTASALLTQSRAALVLVLPLFVLSLAALAARRVTFDSGMRRRLSLMGGAMALLGVAVFATTFGIDRIVARFALSSGRIGALPDLIYVARMYAPVGSGFGTFVPVFMGQESLELVDRTYLNHAHNEYLHVLIEAGLPGLLLVLLAIGWLLTEAWRAWRGRAAVPPLRLAGIAGLLVIALHSLADYPARTPALAATLALLAAIVARDEGTPEHLPRSPQVS